MWQFFQTKYHFYQGVFKNNENSLILQRKKRYHFQKMADKIRVFSIIRRADSGHFFGTSGHFYLCVQRRFRLEFAFARITISMISITTSSTSTSAAKTTASSTTASKTSTAIFIS